jgi:hypothetical protein
MAGVGWREALIIIVVAIAIVGIVKLRSRGN